jgi:hypothetical protein
MLKDGAIWISSNNIKNVITEPLVVENIIHEIAHLLEERFQSRNLCRWKSRKGI